MSETVTIKKQALIDLVRVKNEFDAIVESLELMSDKDFMDSYQKSKDQIKKRDFTDWNEYKILPTKEFSKDFKKLDVQLQKRIKTKVEESSRDPTRYKHLHYELKGSCRLRIGKLRIIFSYNELKSETYLEKIVFDHKYDS